jgi:hypothetical protein
VNGRTIWIVDAHRDGKRYVVHANEKLTAFLELEAAIRGDAQQVETAGANKTEPNEHIHYHQSS